MGNHGIGGHGRSHRLPPGLAKKQFLPPGWRRKMSGGQDGFGKHWNENECSGAGASRTGNVTGGQGALQTSPQSIDKLLAGLPAGIENLGKAGTAATPVALDGNSIGGQLLNAQYLRPVQSGSAIIDSSVLNAARGGDTIGFINALAGNVNASLNNAVNQFMALTG